MAGTSFTRQSTFSDGDTITAALFNNEFNQLVTAFSYASSGTTGHQHDGGAGEGGNIHTIGDQDFLNKIVVDSTNNRWGLFVEVSGSAVEQVRFQDGAFLPVTDSDVDLGTSSLYFKDAFIDSITTTGNVAVGGNLTVTGTTTFNGGTLTLGDSASDNVVFGADVNSSIIPNTDDAYDLGSSSQQWRNLFLDGTAEIDTLAINGTTVTSTAAELNIVDGGTSATSTTLADADRVVVNDNGTMVQVALTDFETYFESALDTLSNVTTVGALNSGSITSGFGAINNGSSAITTTGTVTYGSLSDGSITITAFVDEDDMSSNSATLVPTQQSVKAYVDAQITAEDLDVTTDSGTIAIDLDSETLTISGGTGLDSSATGNAVTLAIDSTVATLTGSQTLTNKSLTAPTLTGTATVASLDISGDIDVDGTTNLDVVDIDGAVDMASTLAVGGVVTANAGVVVDNITIDGTEIDLSSGDLTLDVAGDIFLNADGGQVYFQDGSTLHGSIDMTSGLILRNHVSDADVFIQGNDGGSTINALTLDMSDAGTASFNHDIKIGDDGKVIFGAGSDATISHNSSNNNFQITNSNTSGGMVIQNDGSAGGIALQPVLNENAVFCSPNAQVILYHNGVAKFETTSGGVEVTGDITNDSGNLTLDVAGDIILDADGGDVKFADAGTVISLLSMTGSDTILSTNVSDKDIIFKGFDGGSAITALTLDMSDAGTAIFNHDIKAGSGGVVNSDTFNNQANSANIIYRSGSTTVVGNNATALVISDSGGTSFGGAVTANAGVVVDNITIDGTEIDLSSGDLTLDVAGDIILDADGGDVKFKDGGTSKHTISMQSNGDTYFVNETADADIYFRGVDGSSTITALTLDMSAAGAATFNSTIASGAITSSGVITANDYIDLNNDGNRGKIGYDSNNVFIASTSSVGSIIFKNNVSSGNPPQTGGDTLLTLADGGAASFTGAITANAGVVVDNITIDGTEIDLSSGDLTLDVAGNIILDADGGVIRFFDGSTEYGRILKNNNDFQFESQVDDGDIVFKGQDGTSLITALTLDMSDAGTATFNHDVKIGDNGKAIFGASDDLTISHSTTGNHSIITESGAGNLILAADNLEINNAANNENKIVATSDGAVTLYHDNQAKIATTSGGIQVTGDISNTSGDLTLDVAGDIILDADGGEIFLKDNGTAFGELSISGGNDFVIESSIADKDILFVGTDSSTSITALKLDMSDAGAATFNAGVTIGTNTRLSAASGMLFLNGPSATAFEVGAGSEKMRLTSTGLGIGTNSPNQILTLDVASGDIFQRFDKSGTIKGLVGVADSSASGSSASVQGDMIVRGQTNLLLDTAGTTRVTINSSGVTTFNGAVTADSGISVDNITIDGTEIDLSSGDLTLDVAGHIIFDADGGDFFFKDGGVTKGTIQNSSDDLVIKVNTQDHDLLFKGNDGGSSITALTLDMSAAGFATFNDGIKADGVELQNAIGAVGGTTPKIYSPASGTLAISTNSSEQFRIASDGSLSTPTSGTSNVRFGVNAGNSIASGGTRNTLIGDEAGTAITTGDYNVALGYAALDAEDAGSRATALGYFALSSQNTDTDSYNVAVGFTAGEAITTGIQNTLIGGLVGDALTTGKEQVALGYKALSSETNGHASTAIGYEALFTQNGAGATNVYNVALGYHAGRLVTTGTQNTFVGSLAGDNATTASGNNAFGYNALGATCTGGNNQAFGVGALNANTSGEGNIGIGLNALFSNTGADLNIAIGTGALDAFNVSSGDTYNVAIGDQAGGAMTTGIQNTLIGGLAGDALTDADFNVAVGKESLTTDTLGSKSVAIGMGTLANQNFTSATDTFNTAVGHIAGNAITTGTQNTLIGGLAGDALTVAFNNVAMGYSALGNDLKGGRSVAIGTEALTTQQFGTTTNVYNVGVGYQAGRLITSGVQNTLLGGFAGDALTDADKNVAVGYNALSTDTLGSGSVAVGQATLASQNFSSATTTYNTAIGHQAGNQVTTGNQNTLIGGLAGDALTEGAFNVAVGVNVLTSDTLGSRSVAIGRAALSTQNFTSATDVYNVAVGHEAGKVITTGTLNTIMGGLAGDALTTGFQNIAIGYAALGAETVGGDSIAIGTEALLTQNTSATSIYNVAIGTSAGKSVTTGVSNTLIGGLAGDALTDADYNVAVGFSALSTSALGSRSTAIGHEALKFENPASAANMHNTAVGFNAGNVVTTGIQNTLLGALAGDALTTSTRNTVLGYTALGQETAGQYNTAVGYAALALQNNTGGGNIYNTAVGYNAGAQVTTGTVNTLIGGLAGDALTEGNNNVAIGYVALSGDTLGDRSIAIGRNALLSQNFTSSTDTYNVGIGYGVGSSITTGVSNTLIGGLAGDALTDADDNVAIGRSALGSDTLGSRSVAIGRDALIAQNFTSATQAYNTAVGYNAGNDITTGQQNTFVGGLAGDGTDDGNFNVAVGESALSANCGDGNTALGREAGKSITGAHNTCVGNQAGDTITSGNNNLILGKGCEPSGSGGEVQLVLGANATGVGDGNFTIGNGSTDSNILLGATSITAPSDERMKEEIETSTAGLSFINDLRPVTYKWKKEKDIVNTLDAYVEGSDKRVINETTNHGFIAQEVKTAIDNHPEIKDGFDMWMEKDSDGQQRVAPSALIPILTKAIQEQQAIIESLTTRITALEGE